MGWDDTAELLRQEAAAATKVTIELILKRLKRIPDLKQEVLRLETELTGGKKLSKEAKKALLESKQVGDATLYRLKRDLGKEVDKLNRALSGLLTAKGRERYLIEGGLFEKIFSKDVTGNDLQKTLSAFETNISKYTDTIKSGIDRFTVGHHQHYASLRELGLQAHKAMNPEWWANYTKLAMDRGFNIGDLGILRLARQGHKYLQDSKGELNIDGFLKNLGVTDKTPGFKQLYEATKEIMAHAGGTGGIKIPFQFFKLSPEDALKASMPILDTEKAMAQSGQIWTDLVRNWSAKIQKGGGEVTEDAINQLTRLTKRLKQNLIGTTDGRPNISIEDYIEKGRKRTNVILEQLRGIPDQFDLSGFKKEEQETLENLLTKKAGPLKILQGPSSQWPRQVQEKFATVTDQAGKVLRKVQINPTVQAMTGGVINATKKTPGLRSLIPFAGAALTISNLGDRQTAYTEKPSVPNLLRLNLARLDTGLEGAEMVSGGTLSPVTTPIQVISGLTDAFIGGVTSDTKPKITDQIGTNIGLGLQPPGSVHNLQINRPQSWIAPIPLY